MRMMSSFVFPDFWSVRIQAVIRAACSRFSFSLLCLSSSRRHCASRLKFSAVSKVAKTVPNAAAQAAQSCIVNEVPH